MDAATRPVPVVRAPQLADPSADTHAGDTCAIPDHHEQAVINRRLDDNAV